MEVVIVQVDDNEPTVIDFRRGQNADRKKEFESFAIAAMGRSWQHDGRTREDVEVPAGRFLQAVRETISGSQTTVIATNWYHQAVPFSGMLKSVTSDGSDFVLLDYGYDDTCVPEATSQEASTTEPDVTSPFYVALGVGSGWLLGNSLTLHGASVHSLDWGYSLTDAIDVQGGFRGIANARESAEPALTYDTLSVLVGVRWSPLRFARFLPRPFPYGASALYVQAAMGFTELRRYSLETKQLEARGFALGAAIGWLGFRGADWAFGVELSDHLAFYESDQGMRHNVAIVGVAQLYLPWGR